MVGEGLSQFSPRVLLACAWCFDTMNTFKMNSPNSTKLILVHVNIFNTFDHVLENVYSSYLVSELPNIYFTWICTPHRLTLTLIKLCQSKHKYLQTGCICARY